MSARLFVVFLLFCSICSAQPDSVAESNERIRRDHDQMQRDRAQERRDYEKRDEDLRRRAEDKRRAGKLADIESRIGQLENDQNDALYEYRMPTRQGVNALQEKWKTAHPFTFSGEMPDFRTQKIRIRRADTVQPEQRIVAKEQAIPRDDGVMTPGAMEMVRNMQRADALEGGRAGPRGEQIQVAAPAAVGPNPYGVAMRTLSNGRVVAIIGGKAYQFANRAEATAFIEKQRP